MADSSWRLTKWWWLSYFLATVAYAWWSYGLTAPNLVLSSWPPYWQFQTWMWEVLFNNRPLLTHSFMLITAWLWLSFGGLIWSVARQRLLLPTTWAQLRSLLAVLALSTAPLLLANNALSYDVFNYIFNAKMVTVYDANPHVKVALDFATDPWVRFMHNTHTPAPYGYGWTALSLLPFLAGQGKFVLVLASFRAFSWLSWLGLIAVIWWGAQQLPSSAKRYLWPLLVLVLNPLITIEVLANVHNDLWMMLPALLSLVLARVSRKQQGGVRWRTLGLSALLLAASISIKLATVALVPAWLLALTVAGEWWLLAAPLAMAAPLITPRSQQFHPWYLSWVLCWLPWLITTALPRALKTAVQFGVTVVVVMAITSLYRYVPYLWHGQHSPEILNQQKMITWCAVPIAACLFAWHWFKARKNR